MAAASAAVIEGGDEGCGEGDSEGFGGGGEGGSAAAKCEEGGGVVGGGDVGGGESRDPRVMRREQ